MSKAETTNPALDSNVPMGVFAYWNNGSYFGNTMFIKYDGSWVAFSKEDNGAEVHTPKYWPVSGAVDFVVYAPYATGVTSTSASNLQITKDSGDQTDWLYGKATSPKTDAAVTVTLYHALTQVIVNVKGTSDVTVEKVELLSTVQNATGTITFGTAPTRVVWEPNQSVTKDDMVLFSGTAQQEGAQAEGETLTIKATGSCLVVPTVLSNEAIRITYKLTGSDNSLTHTTVTKSTIVSNQLGTEWLHGTKYIYNVSITPEEIKFNPDVQEWTDGGTDL